MKFWDGFIKTSVLLICLGIALPNDGQSKAFTPLKLITFNIRYDNAQDGSNSWVNRSGRVKQFLKDENADIIGIQEALFNQASELDEFLSSQTPSTYLRIGVGREDGKTKGEFAPIYFKQERFQLIRQECFWLSETPHEPSKGWDAACERIATVAVLFDLQTLDTLVVINSHWDHVGTEARAHSAEMISNYVKTFSSETTLFVMGDFNSIETDRGIQVLRENLFDSCPEKQAQVGTFNGFNHGMDNKPRIDYVLYRSNGFRPTSYSVCNENKLPNEYISDHYAVVSEFEKTQLSIDFHVCFVYDNHPLSDTKELEVRNLKCYIGNIKAVKNDGRLVGFDAGYRLLDYNNPASLQWNYLVNEVPEKLIFNLGVDSLTNAEGVHGDDLDPSKGMYWSWQSGYIQFKFEGRWNGKEYSLHLGGFERANFSSREHVQLISPRLSLPSLNTKAVAKSTTLYIDIKPFLDFATSSEINKLMSPSPATTQFMDAIEKGISVVRIQ